MSNPFTSTEAALTDAVADNLHAPIFLVGFMGAGKTTVGQALAQLLPCRFIDLDRMIEASEARTVEQIFTELGEAEFRRLESVAIQSCRGMKNLIIALGGGAYIAAVNRRVLREIGITIWLDCPLEVCLDRIRGDGSRPLLRSDEEMKALLEIRRPAYALADFIVQTGHRSPDEIARAICHTLGLKGESRR